MLLLGEAETEIRSGLKSRLGVMGFSITDAILGLSFSGCHYHPGSAGQMLKKKPPL